MAYTFEQFVDHVIAGDAVSVRGVTRTTHTVNIGGIAASITEEPYDLGRCHTAQTVLESQALRRAVYSGVILAEAGTTNLQLNTTQTKLWDGTRTLELEANGGVPVNLQDQHTPAVDYFMHIHLGDVTLASTVVPDTNTCTLVTGHGTQVGELLVFKENTRYCECLVVNVATDTITMEAPFDYAFTSAATTFRANINLNVNGETTRIIAHIKPPSGITWDITRILFHIQDNLDMDDSKFGGITALTNGVVFRVNNNILVKLFTIKSNGMFALRGFNPQYATKAAAGKYSIRGMRTFAGQNETGVVLRITEDETVEVVIQDNLTGLETFNVVCQGHVVSGM